MWMEAKQFNVSSYFFDTIELLRTKGDIILHSSFVQWSEDDEEYVTKFLEEEYNKEACNYPGMLPAFRPEAALWSAKTVFLSAQLLMLRDIPEVEFPKLLPPFNAEINLGAVLSGDLCLRFLPEIIEKAEDIDTYDGLIPLLDNLLLDWGYSSVGRRFADTDAQLRNTEVLKTKEFQLLLIERIVERNAQHAIHQELREIVQPYLEIDINEQ